MKNIKAFLNTRYGKNIKAHLTIPEKQGDFSDFPEDLNIELKNFLQKEGINSLYSHQEKAFHHISNNDNTLLVSNTASGKTLSFFLPVLNEYSKEKSPFSVLFMYPTKALSRDQESTFGGMMRAAKKGGRLGTFDGDTPRDERARIQRSADFIITNPDMLHAGILPNHNRKWKDFLSRLRYIVVDEVHIYRGAFGSHVSNVFRRLKRVCEIHGSNPVFICSSATIGNPANHVEALFHEKFEIINIDGAPKPARELYFINPPLVQSHGDTLYRKGTASISIPLIRKAVESKIRTICFARSRQEVERLYRAVVDGKPDIEKLVKPYRGGLLPNERRQLERDLKSGKINTIITTNALELGIDIGDLELCILSGYPGTIASFWQQSGRVGRKDNKSLIVYIAKDTPIDQYLINHSNFVTDTPVEEALLNADNPYILLQHLPCMAHEHPLRDNEPGFDSMTYSESVKILKEDETIVPYGNLFRYALEDYPAKGVNLRGMTDHNIEIHCGTEVIGELDPIGARGTLYKDAIYQHLGTRYMSMELDLEKKLCRVEPVNVDYYTEAVWEGRIEMIDPETRKNLQDSTLEFGFMNINIQPKLYKKIRERSMENIGYGPITLPPFEYDTTGFSLIPGDKWLKSIEEVDKRYIGAALYGLSYILRHTSPGICMADIGNISTNVSLMEKDKVKEKWTSALYLYDTIEGGVGYAEKIFEKIEYSLTLCREIMNECSCKSGCPSCVPSLPPGVTDEELESILIETNASTECTLSLINYFLDGKVIIPEIKEFETLALPAVEEYPEDLEKKALREKLNRASKILKRKRERLH